MAGTSQTKKHRIQQLQKALLTLIILLLLFIALKDSLPDIWQQLKKTSPAILTHILLASVFYHCSEGLITAFIARKHLPEFSLKTGIQCAFYCSFYRVATFGSGAGAAGTYFLHKNGINIAQAAGMYMMQYIFHKISIALYAVLMLVCNFSFMYHTYYQYSSFLAIGIGITLLIVVFLFALCFCAPLHSLIYRLCCWLCRKGIKKIDPENIREQLALLRNTSTLLINDKKLLFQLIIINFIKLSFWYSIPFLILHKQNLLSLTASLSITSLMTALAGVIPTPAGIGSTEFVYLLLYGPVTGTAAAASSMLLYRFATYLFPVLPGGIIILIRKRNDKKGKDVLT